MSIRFKKIARNIMFMLSVPLLVSAFIFANVSTRNEICRGFKISIANNDLSFVTKHDIETLLKEKGITVNRTRIRSIHIHELEKSLESNKWISKVNIYVSSGNIIHINAIQKRPVVRIQPLNEVEEPYFLDQYANPIPYSPQYIPQLPVVTTLELGFSKAELKLKSELVKLAQFISKDSFWNQAITQINIDESGLIELIPAMGTQRIILGNTDALESKMSKLFQLYQQGYYTVNWNHYDEIDLRFDKQVVCRNTNGMKLSVDPYDRIANKQKLQTAQAAASKQSIAPQAPAKNQKQSIQSGTHAGKLPARKPSVIISDKGVKISSKPDQHPLPKENEKLSSTDSN